MELTLHHIGIAVNSIDESVEHYQTLFGEGSISKKYYIASEQVNVCFINIGRDTFIELVEATSEDSGIARLRRKGYTYYHMAYLVNNIEESVYGLVSMNYRAMSFFNSEAFGGKRCIFLFSPDSHLIELIEK